MSKTTSQAPEDAPERPGEASEELMALTAELIACLHDGDFEALTALEERRTAVFARFAAQYTSGVTEQRQAQKLLALEEELASLLKRKREELSAQRLAASRSAQAGKAYSAALAGGILNG